MEFSQEFFHHISALGNACASTVSNCLPLLVNQTLLLLHHESFFFAHTTLTLTHSAHDVCFLLLSSGSTHTGKIQILSTRILNSFSLSVSLSFSFSLFYSHRRYRHTNRTRFCCEAVRLFVGEYNYVVTTIIFLFLFLRFFVSSFSSFLHFLRFLFFIFFYSATVLGHDLKLFTDGVYRKILLRCELIILQNGHHRSVHRRKV